MKERVAEITLGLVLAALLATALLFEYVAAVTLYPIALALFASAGLGVGALFLLAGRRGIVLSLAACYLFGLLALRFVEISPVKPFRAFYEAVEPGMTRAQLSGELARRFPVAGRYEVPRASQTGSSLWWTLDPTGGEYDSELVRVELADGLVTGKDYLPD